MKKIYLFGLASLVALGMNAQTTIKVNNPLKGKANVNTNLKKRNANGVARNGGGNNSVQQITGSLVCNTQYVAGTTMDLDFVLELTNTDAEYGDMLVITLPAGFTINSTTNTPDLGPADGAASSDGPEAFDSISVDGQSIYWGNDDNYYGGIVPSYDPAGPGTYPITLNVTIAGGTTGIQNATYTVSGDGFGANPADLINATCPIFEQGMTIVDGKVSMGGPQSLTNCGNTLVPIGIRIKNSGNDSIMNFPVSYQVDANTPVSETITDTILPGDSLDYLFLTPFDFSVEADYVVKMYTSVPGELIPGNDTLTVDFQNTVPVDLSTTTYTNGFEANPDYFALYIGANATSTANWALSTTTPHGGARCLNLQAAAAIADAWVMFKCMDVTAGDNYRLSYWTRTNTNYNGGVSVSINTTGQTADDFNAGLEIKPLTANTANNQWKKDSVDYMAPISGTIYVGIRGAGTASGSGTMVKLDDVQIMKVAPVGIKDNASTEAIAVFPNPSNGIFTVRAIENGSSVEVYSIIGENVYSSSLVKGNNNVDLSNMAAGTYIVKVKSGNNTTTKRVVINK